MQHVKSYTVFMLGPLMWSEIPDSQSETGNKIQLLCFILDVTNKKKFSKKALFLAGIVGFIQVLF